MNENLFSVDAELAVLNIILLNPDLVYSLLTVKPRMMSSKPNIVILTAIQELAEADSVPEISLVQNYLRSKGRLDSAGGEDYFKYLGGLTFDKGNLKDFEKIVVDSYKAREVISISAGVNESIKSSGDVNGVINKLKDSLDGLLESGGGEDTSDIKSLVQGTYDAIVERVKNPGLNGSTFGIENIDLVTGGIGGGDLWVIGARPSMGKTALMCNSVIYSAGSGVRSLVFSKEMRKQVLMERLISIASGISLIDIRLGTINNKQLGVIANTLREIKNLPIYIDTNFSSNLDYISSTIRKYHQLYGIQTVFVDYLQLVSERGEDDTAELGRITRGMKLLANQLNIGVVLLSQLNRKVEERKDKRPILSDLRQSGNIEEDIDVGAFLYRDEVYNEGTKRKGELEFIIRKHRNGPIGTILLDFDAVSNKIEGRAV